jgi:hypothetical protein
LNYNNNGDPDENGKSGSKLWVVVGGIAGGVAAVCVLLIVVVLLRRRNYKKEEKKQQVPQQATSEDTSAFHVHIGTPNTFDDDVSTLENPTVLGGMSYGEEHTASITAAERYLKSQLALGAEGHLDSSEDTGRSVTSQASSSVGTSAFVKRFQVEAPPGKLGLVLMDNGHAGEGAPMVRFMRPDSVLSNRVRVGDQLFSVNSRDVSAMTAEEVSSLISSMSNQTRVFVFVRQECLV